MRLLLLIVLVAIFASGVVWMANRAYRDPQSSSIVTIDQVMRLASSEQSSLGQPLGRSAEEVSMVQNLPHLWHEDTFGTLDNQAAPGRHRAGRRQWSYEASLVLPVPDYDLWALYLPEVLHDAQVTLNGAVLGEPLRPPNYSRHGLTSLYFAIPSRIVKPGDNLLQLQVTAQPANRGMLGKFYIGPASELRPLHDGRVQQSRLLWYSAITLLLLAITGGVLARGTNNDLTYVWFSAMCVTWVIALSTRLLTDSPVGWQWIEFISIVDRAVFICMAYAFCLSYIHELTRTRSATIAVLGIIAALVHGSDALQPFESNWFLQLSMGALQFYGLYVAAIFIHRALTERDDGVLALSVGGVLVLGFGIHDTFLRYYSQDPGINYLNYLSPVMFMIAGYVLLRRFSRALEASEQVTEQALPAASTAGRGRSTTGTRRLLVAERERIMRDMHDGVGGHLVSSLSILRNHNISDPDLEETLNQALVDLRLMIDSLEDTEGDLSVAVAMLKERTQRTLRGSALTANWKIDEILLPARGPADTLQILRILQETISNVLKHANATQLEVSAGMADPGTARFVVRDNGSGYDSAATPGRGLMNMTRRAESLDAEISFTSSVGTGTEVTLLVPDKTRLATEEGRK